MMEGAWNAITYGIKSLWENTSIIDTMVIGILGLWAGKSIVSAMASGVASLFSSTAGAAGGAAGGGARGLNANKLLKGTALVGVGLTLFDMFKTAQDDSLSRDEKTEAYAESGGTLVGGLAGAKLGATVGLLGGPIGSLIGAAIGGTIGATVGAFGGRKIGEQLTGDDLKTLSDQETSSANTTATQLSTLHDATTEQTNEVITLNTRMNNIEISMKQMVELQQQVIQLAMEDIEIQRNIFRNTKNGYDISAGGMTNFRR
jgi:phage tail tape-measure protein